MRKPIHTKNLSTSLLSLPATLASPAGQSARLTILIFHRVLPAQDPLFPGEEYAESFTWKMRLLSDHFNVLPLSEAVDRLRTNSLPARAVCITFDDGYRDNSEVALNILQKAGLTATFFIATGYMGNGRMFNDTVIDSIRRTAYDELDLKPMGLGRYSLKDHNCRKTTIEEIILALKYLPQSERAEKAEMLSEICRTTPPDDLMMSQAQIRQLHGAGMEIGAHTVSHPILKEIDEQAAFSEIEQSRDQLTEIIGTKPDLFAYPNGKPEIDYKLEHAHMVKKLGFSCAVTTSWGTSTSNSDPYQLPRIGPWDNTPFRFMGRIIRAARQNIADIAV